MSRPPARHRTRRPTEVLDSSDEGEEASSSSDSSDYSDSDRAEDGSRDDAGASMSRKKKQHKKSKVRRKSRRSKRHRDSEAEQSDASAAYSGSQSSDDSLRDDPAPLSIRVPELDVKLFGSWEELDKYLANYSRKTYQLYSVRTATPVKTRNERIKKSRTPCKTIPEELEFYNKTFVSPDCVRKLFPGSKDSDFYTVFASLCDLVNASKSWVIVICAATIYQPVDEFLAASPQWREMLQTTSLKRPKINGRDVFDTFAYGNGALTQLLVDDMGGHGRALEELFNVMLQNQGQAFEFIPVMHNVLAAIRQAYPAIVAQMQSMKQAFLAVISRRSVDGNSRFGSLTLDQVISCGLIRLDGTHLQCPFVLYMLLETHDIPWNKQATYAPAERLEDLKPWQLWEQFSCKFRALKSEAFSQKESVLWTDIHYGARFGDGCKRHVIERQLTYAHADKRMPTKTKGFKKGRCSCGNDRGKCFLYQPADGSPSGDAFLCLEDATKGFFHEVHQCKCVEGKLSLDVFE
ncbi:hypothetical protein F442_18024 [Phytophthora nicotianae P10297]|uniref:Uncharacterized protein n=1 Tax=Phytophthora nicotianae P10297 TaxID=1317064 RepID=W2YF68_PHYNI|nr:hypothetical protein F442_18024 [Phytophthora nicotianae P10297]